MYYAGRALATHQERQRIQLPGGRSVPRRRPYYSPGIPLAAHTMPYHIQGTVSSPMQPPHLVHPAARPIYQPPTPFVYQPYGFQYPMTPFALTTYPGGHGATRGSAGYTPDGRRPSRPREPIRHVRDDEWWQRPRSSSFRQRVARLLGITPGRASTISSPSSESTQLGFREPVEHEERLGSRRPSAVRTRSLDRQAPETRSPGVNANQLEAHSVSVDESSSSRTDAATVHSDDFDRPQTYTAIPTPMAGAARTSKRGYKEQRIPSESSRTSASNSLDRPRSLPTRTSLIREPPHIDQGRSVSLTTIIPLSPEGLKVNESRALILSRKWKTDEPLITDSAISLPADDVVSSSDMRGL